MLSILAADSQPPLWDRLLVAAVGPLVTVLIGGLVVWGVTSTVQRRREQADRVRDEKRADLVRNEDLSSRDDALRQDIVGTMTETEVFSPGIHTQLNGPEGVAGQGFDESSATSGAGPRRRLPAGGTRHRAGTGA